VSKKTEAIKKVLALKLLIQKRSSPELWPYIEDLIVAVTRREELLNKESLLNSFSEKEEEEEEEEEE
jgi:hypothetical protein